MLRIIVAISGLCTTLVLCFALLRLCDRVYVFKDLSGPREKSVMPAITSTKMENFEEGSENRLAVLVTDPNSAWLGIAHGLKSIGIPFIITTDYRRALKHKVIFVYPMMSGQDMSQATLRALANFPREGGILIGQNVLGGGLNGVFGFDDVIGSRLHRNLKLLPEQAITAEFSQPEELTLPIASEIRDMGAYAYSNPSVTPLAVYEDGSAAITQKLYEKGRAYAFGLDLGYLLLKGYNKRQEKIAKYYANRYVPTLDVLLRLLKGIYRDSQPNSVTLGTVPFGKKIPVILTHDIDFSHSLKNALEFAAFERERHLSGTYFIQTKYVRDWNDQIFFNEEGAQIVSQLQKMGGEIASHSVSHCIVFSKFPLGDGAEQYPSYVPFVRSQYVCENGTILGELRVSRFLLEQSLSGERVVSFRPGHLENPWSLPEALAATGYRYSSSATANDSLTHLPFRLNYGRGTTSESEIFEFPITIEDELNPPMIDRLPQAIELAKKLKRYGGLFNILIHPNIIDQKLEFERRFINAMGDSAWYGSLRQFGDWWRARDQVEVDARQSADQVIVTLGTKIAISGLTLELPAELKFVAVEPSGLKVSQEGNLLIVDHLQGPAKLVLAQTRTDSP